MGIERRKYQNNKVQICYIKKHTERRSIRLKNLQNKNLMLQPQVGDRPKNHLWNVMYTQPTFLEKSHVHRYLLEPDHRRHASVRPEVSSCHVHQAEDVGATEDATRGVTPGPGDCRGRVAIDLTRQRRGVAEVCRHVR